MVVGTVAFAIDLGSLLVLAQYLHVIAANTIAFVIANAANFLMGHVWVFERPLVTISLRTYARVLLISVIGLAVNDAVVWLSAIAVGLSLLISKVIATLVGLVWNYAARVSWVYRDQSSA